MAISATVLTENASATDTTSYVTASVTPTANRLLILAVSHGNTGGAAAAPSSVTGNGLTWVQINTIQNTNHRTTLFRAMGASPSAGTITINFGATQHNCIWKLVQFSGVDTSGTNGSGAIVQSNQASNTGSPATVTLASGTTAGNVTFGVMSQNVTGTAATVGAGFLELGTQFNVGTPSNRQAVEWDPDALQTVQFTTGAVQWAIAAVEVKAGTDPGAGTVRSVRITATANTWVATPDNAALDITGDIDLRMKVALDDWTPGGTPYLISKSGTASNNSYNFRVTTSGELELSWTTDGVSANIITRTSTVSLPSVGILDGQKIHVAATLDVNNGAAGHDVKFWYEIGDTAPADVTTWTQLGTTITTAGTTSIFAGGNNVALGSRGSSVSGQITGNIYYAAIRNGINGSVVANPTFDYGGDAWNNGDLAPTEANDSAGRIWALAGSANIVQLSVHSAAATGSGTGGNGTVAAFVERMAAAAGSGLGGNGTVAAFLEKFAAALGAGLGDGTASGIAYNPIGMPEVFIYLETEEDVWVSIGDDNRSGGTTRGRQRELDKFQTGTCFITQSNADRKYDVTYEASPLYGYLKPNRRIKVEAFQNGTTYPIFMGYIDGISEQSNGPHDAVVTITLSDALKVLNRYTINGTSFDSELPGERITALLDLIEYPAGLRDIDDGTETLQALTDVASTLLSHAETVALTEFGDFFVMADGTFRFKGRDAAIDEPLQGEFGSGPGEIPYRSLRPEYDDLLIRNPVTVDRVDGTAQTVEDTGLTAPPPAGYGVNHFTLSGTYHDSDANAEDAAAYILQRYKEPKRRISGLTLGPPPVGFEAVLFPQMLGRDLTEKVMIVERPQNVPPEIRQASVIEGISHSWSAKYWATTWNVSPGFVIGTEYWRIGTPGSSEIGLTTKVYF